MDALTVKILVFALAFIAGALTGYILKDRITTEKQVKIVINKPKIKGDGSTIDFDEMEVDAKEEKLAKPGLLNSLFNRKRKKNENVQGSA